MDVEIGGRGFVFDTDAYERLSEYLAAFRHRLDLMSSEKQDSGNAEGIQSEVMDEVERRMAELFMKEIGSFQQTVSLNLVERIIAQLGMPDGDEETPYSKEAETAGPSTEGSDTSESAQGRSVKSDYASSKPLHRLYRDYDNRKIAGVCSGFAAYTDLDLTLVRVLMLVIGIFGGIGLWMYLIVWICAPNALTPTQKCELRGLPVTAENLTRFSESKAKK